MAGDYDVIIVGARCAGAPTAMLLARRGYRVLLADRAAFPSDIPHGHFVHRHGPPRLARWGVLDRIVATDCPPVTTFTMDLGDFPLTGRDLAADGVAFGYAPRRSVLDRVLVEAAVEAGAELRERFAVEELVRDGDRVAGVRGRDLASGRPATERAAVTVGADGRRSRVARLAGATAYQADEVATCWYFSYWGDVPIDGLHVHARRDHVVFAFPTNGGLTGVFAGWPRAELPAVRADVEGRFMAALDRVPGLGERIRAGRRAERFAGATDLPNHIRTSHGPGWALVGDAGCHKDPYQALGICDAFRDAELLAEAIDEGLSGRRWLPDALECYELRRNEATRRDYAANLRLARFAPVPDDVWALRAALRHDQEETNRFFLAQQGLIPPADFFAPANLQRIMAAGGAAPGAAGASSARRGL